MNHLLHSLKRRWALEGLSIRHGVDISEVSTAESRCRVRFPEDFRRYFLTVDGMSEDAMDQHLIRFWPLAEVQPVSEAAPELSIATDYTYIVFADYSLWAHGYALRCDTTDSIVVIVGGTKIVKVADSFSHFLLKYLEQPDELFSFSDEVID